MNLKPTHQDGPAPEYVLSSQECVEVCRLATTGEVEELKRFYRGIVESKKRQLGPQSLCPDLTCGSPFLAAARLGHLNVMRYFFSEESFGVSVNSRSCLFPHYSEIYAGYLGLKDSTALSAASIGGHLGVVQYLLQLGANVNAVDACGSTPLCNAAANGHVTTADLLLKNGANPYHTNYKGFSAMHLAALHLSQGGLVIQCLLSSGVAPVFQTATNEADCAPRALYLAAAHKNLSAFQQLINRPTCPPACKADAFLLLGASYCMGPLGCYSDTVQQNWITGFSIREQQKLTCNTLPPKEAFGHRTEMKSRQEFDQLQQLPNFAEREVFFQALLIMERCVGFEPYRTLSVAQKFFQRRFFHEAELLLIRAMTTYTDTIYPLPTESMYRALAFDKGNVMVRILLIIARSLKQMVCIGYHPSYRQFASYCIKMLEISVRMKHDGHLKHFITGCARVHIVLQMLYIFSLWLQTCGQEESAECEKLGEAFVHLTIELRPFLHGDTILHICLPHWEPEIGFVSRRDPLAPIPTLRMLLVPALLRWGADAYINSLNSHGQRPVHLAATLPYPLNQHILSMLMQSDAHPDAVNSKGETARDIYSRQKKTGPAAVASWHLVELRLSCFACRVIVKEQIPYENLVLPSHIKKLIRLHDKKCGEELL